MLVDFFLHLKSRQLPVSTKELLALQTGLVKPMADKSTAYAQHVQAILTGSTADFAKALADQGVHLTAVGGSDDHRAGLGLNQTQSPIGSPTTLLYASELSAVGLTAAFARVLGDAGISANVIAGYYHDHIFVSWTQREAAVAALQALATAGGRNV